MIATAVTASPFQSYEQPRTGSAGRPTPGKPHSGGVCESLCKLKQANLEQSLSDYVYVHNVVYIKIQWDDDGGPRRQWRIQKLSV